MPRVFCVESVDMCECVRVTPLSQLMDCSVRMRSCSGPVAREMSKSVPRKLLVAAVYRRPSTQKTENEISFVLIRLIQ